MKFLSNVAAGINTYRFALVSLISLNTFLLFLLVVGACKKDIPDTRQVSSLSVQDAKLVFASAGFDNYVEEPVLRNDSLETPYSGPKVIPDWAHAETYFDAIRKISVVEVPVELHTFTKIVIMAPNTPLDSSAVDQTIQLNKLVFTQDTSGTISFAVMKLVGTPAYLAAHDISLNSFRQLDLDFQGMLGYYNLKDSLLKAYLFNEGHIFEVQSQSGNGGNVPVAQDRWGYCIDHYIYINCTRANHTWEQRNICECGTAWAPDCIPPQRIPVYVKCGVEVFFEELIEGLGGLVPPKLPDNSIWNPAGNGGGVNSGGNGNQLSCFADAVRDFDEDFEISLLTDEYENFAYGGCMSAINCNAPNQTNYYRCVLESILVAPYSQDYLIEVGYRTKLDIIIGALISKEIPLDLAKRIFDAVLKHGSTAAQVNFIIELAAQNPSIDIKRTLEENFAFVNPPAPAINDPITIDRLICPAVFSFAIGPNGDPSGSTPEGTAILQDVKFQFTFNGNAIPLQINNLCIGVGQWSGGPTCLNEAATYAAAAINAAVSQVQTFANSLDSGTSIEIVTSEIKKRLILSLNDNLYQTFKNCNPQYTAWSEVPESHLSFRKIHNAPDPTNCDLLMANCP